MEGTRTGSFVGRWAEPGDEEDEEAMALAFAEDDVKYVAETLHMGGCSLDKYHKMADAVEV